MSKQQVEFPILCETCLGDNPFIRMTKDNYGQSCKICDRPFTVFRWRPGAKARFKKTQICKTCAQLKNVCQTCILDLQFGLPVQVRDKALSDATKISIPRSVANRDFQFENYEKQLEENGTGAALGLATDSANPYSQAAASTWLSNLARKRPYYTRNLPHLCSFFERGECKRGSECPYRHEKDEYPEELRDQKIKNRFYGVNDPVAKKILRMNADDFFREVDVNPPEDETISTLFIGGVDDRFTSEDLQEHLKKFGDITIINLVPLKGCAFVTFSDRSCAEKAMTELKGVLFVNDVKLKVNWSKTSFADKNRREENELFMPPPGMSSLPKYYFDPEKNCKVRMPLPPSYFVPAPPGSGGAIYPSMDPNNYAASLAERSVRDGANQTF